MSCGSTLAEVAARQGVGGGAVFIAGDRVVAAELARAVADGRLPARGQRREARFAAAQTSLFPDRREDGADAAPPIEFGFPCLRPTGLVPASPGMAPAGGG